MSRQFRVYLLPSDIDDLIIDLKEKFDIKLYKEKSSTPEPVEIKTPVEVDEWRPNSTHVRCFIAPANEIRMNTWFVSTQGYWVVEEEPSEIIEFSGCDYDGKTLVIGRFYFHTNFLIGDTVWPKREAFLKWAAKIFKSVKKQLSYSEELEAYLGTRAEDWRKNGGRFL
jgi:hypothetical protein